MKKATVFCVAFALLLVVIPEGAWAQLPSSEALASQNLRGYTHMFIAYFIAWAIILGWVVSIARRLGRVEQALKE